MKIHERAIDYYLHWMASGRPFTFAGYSDAEWYCILGLRQGEHSGFGQTFDAQHGQRLLDALRRRHGDPRWITAVPKCLYGLPEFCDHQLDWFLGRENIRLEAYERDMVLDDLAAQAGLHPLIRELRARRPVLVGPAPLRACRFLAYRQFVEVSSPDFHLEPGGIERAVAEVLAGYRRMHGRVAVCVSAGVSAAVILDQLHDAMPDSWLIDCGSIWDAFVGIGGQRQWRADLYADPAALEQWKRKCLTGRE